jgi:hypothetical protein
MTFQFRKKLNQLELLDHSDGLADTDHPHDVPIQKEIESIESMRKTVPIFQEAVTQDMAHRLHAKVQFVAIKKIQGKLSTCRTLLVIDHKQKVLPFSFREGMSLLGAMLVRRVVRDGKVGLEYIFFDCIIDKYSSQDNMQVLGVPTSLLPLIKKLYPEINELTVQSDNASCLASRYIIAYMHHLNKELADIGLKVIQWTYTEAQTGKGRLDSHFSFVNILFHSYAKGGHDIRTEQQIYDALCHNGGLMGSTAALVDRAELGIDDATEHSERKQKEKKVCVVSKPFKTRKIGVHETTRNPVEDRRRSKSVYTFGSNEGRRNIRSSTRHLSEREFEYANLEVKYVQQASIVPSGGR